MRAVRVHEQGGRDKIQLDHDAPVPKVAPGQVLIKTVFAGVNFIDTYHRSGLYKVDLPFTLGVDGAGHITEIGPGVDPAYGLAIGDAVAYFISGGAYAEYIAVSADHLFKIPPGIDLQTGVAAAVQGLTAVFLATLAYPVQKDDWVLVHAAAGGTGQILTQVTKHLGAHVIGVVSTQEKADIAKGLGADHVFLSDQADLVEQVIRVADGKGVHAVFDGVGAATFEVSKQVLRHLGTLLSFGNASGAVPPVPIFSLVPKNIKLMRPSLVEVPKAGLSVWRALIERTLDLLQSGAFKVHIQEVLPLSEAARAHELIESRKTTGKLLLSVTE